MVKAITNATVPIFLAKIGRLNLLEVYCPIITTSTVKKEILEGKKIQKKEKEDLECFFKKNIEIQDPKKTLSLNLGQGERSALSLCIEKNIPLFLSDDKGARKKAEILQLHPFGTLGIILANVEKGNMKKREAKELINTLVQHSYYISTDVYAKFLEIVDRM
jgi:predicted nucleic acid-binding protein